MTKNKYISEFEINASVKILFPYISTPAGLSDWFADDVVVEPNKKYNFIWDGKNHRATIEAFKLNKYIKFEFLPESGESSEDPSYLEFRLDFNEMTDASYLKVTDYSAVDEDEKEEIDELWEQLVGNLRERVGG